MDSSKNGRWIIPIKKFSKIMVKYRFFLKIYFFTFYLQQFIIIAIVMYVSRKTKKNRSGNNRFFTELPDIFGGKALEADYQI